MLNDEIKNYINRSVLCWLATADADGMPNVSPKEMFTYKGDDTLLIAHIASPNSITNIETNANVCVSFVDIFVQKGCKMKGRAKIIRANDAGFEEDKRLLTELYSDQYPIKAIIKIAITQIASIVAPSYFLYDTTTEQSQIQSAMETYGIIPKQT